MDILLIAKSISRVNLKHDAIVPAHCEMIVNGYIKHHDFDGDDFMVEPLPGGMRNGSLLIGAVVVKSAQATTGVPIRIMNTSTEDIKLNANTTIGIAHEVADITIIDEAENNNFNREDRLSRVCRVHTHPGKFTSPSPLHRDGEVENMHPIVNELCERSSEGMDDNQQQQLRKLLTKHQHNFATSSSDLGRTSVLQHEIKTGQAKPVRQPARRPPRSFEGEEENIIDEQLKAGIIRPSSSPWASPLVYVKKKDGTIRPCVDYRKLNAVTQFDSFPLPRIDDCLDCLDGSSYFSTLDLQSGYWQVEVKESDREKTAFRTRSGLFEYNVMPFGLSNAPSTFERCMELVLKGLQWKTLLIYLDDVIIFSRTFEEHISRLDEVFYRLSKAGLKLKPSKCNLFQSEVLYLGHIITSDGVKANPEKLAAVADWATPTNVKDIRSFMGLCSYYRRFIKGFSHIARPLTRLLESGVKFEWTDECMSAFSELKRALVSDNVMAYPLDTGQFIMDTDASDYGIGATLSQMQWNEQKKCFEERPISFASKALTRTQRRYCVTRRELLAIVTFVNQFRHYLLGREFVIRTDHSALRWVMSFRDPSQQDGWKSYHNSILRWSIAREKVT